MNEREMHDALEQARASQSAREEDIAARYDAEESELLDRKERRAVILRQVVDSWLATMTADGRPGMEVIRVQDERAAGLLRRRRERYVTEVPGWMVVRHGTASAMDSAGQRRFEALYIGVDGRLFHSSTYAFSEQDMEERAVAEEIRLEDEYEIRRQSPQRPPQVQFPGTHRTELLGDLPRRLAELAAQNDVSWQASGPAPPTPLEPAW
jgi:hypothetical protein